MGRPKKQKNEVATVSDNQVEVVAEMVEDGIFLESLKRNNRQIREDRAIAIVEDTSLAYKRFVEDLEIEMKRLMRERENMLDLSPTDARSLVMAADFDVPGFIEKDVELGIKMRNVEIKLEIAAKRFKTLFGE